VCSQRSSAATATMPMRRWAEMEEHSKQTSRPNMSRACAGDPEGGHEARCGNAEEAGLAVVGFILAGVETSKPATQKAQRR